MYKRQIQLQGQVEGYTSAIWLAVGILVAAAAIALTLINVGKPGSTVAAGSSDASAEDEAVMPVAIH